MKHYDPYKEPFNHLFGAIMKLAADSTAVATTLSEVSIKSLPTEYVPPGLEKDVLIMTYLLNGLTAEEIGKKFNRSPRTIEARLSDLRIKYGVNSTLQLVGIFFRNGWIK